MRIVAYLSVQLSPPPSSLTPALRHVGVDTIDLVSEESEAFDFEGGDDSRSKGGPLPCDESAAANESNSDDLDTTKPESN